MNYEIMFIVRPNIEEGALKEVIKSFEKILTDNKAKIESSKDFGQKELAYSIKGHKSGFYYLYEISSKDDKAEKEFDRLALISEDIVRHMIIRKEK
jgi:small subunit ribosomal protein S6